MATTVRTNVILIFLALFLCRTSYLGKLISILIWYISKIDFNWHSRQTVIYESSKFCLFFITSDIYFPYILFHTVSFTSKFVSGLYLVSRLVIYLSLKGFKLLLPLRFLTFTCSFISISASSSASMQSIASSPKRFFYRILLNP